MALTDTMAKAKDRVQAILDKPSIQAFVITANATARLSSVYAGFASFDMLRGISPEAMSRHFFEYLGAICLINVGILIERVIVGVGGITTTAKSTGAILTDSQMNRAVDEAITKPHLLENLNATIRNTWQKNTLETTLLTLAPTLLASQVSGDIRMPFAAWATGSVIAMTRAVYKSRQAEDVPQSTPTR